MGTDRFAPGAVGFDVGQVPAQPVIITDADKGPVADLSPALQEMVLDAPGNQAFGVDETSECVGVQYIELDGTGGKEYTMPERRVALTAADVETDGGVQLPPHEYIQYRALVALFTTAEFSDVSVRDVVALAERTGIPEAVVDTARSDATDLVDV